MVNKVVGVELFHARRLDKPGPFLVVSACVEPRSFRWAYCHGSGHVVESADDELVLWLAGLLWDFLF
jgi:hypothetical protein